MVFTHDLTNKQQFCMICTLIDHRNDVRMFKKRFAFTSQTMENCCRFFFTIILTVFTPRFRRSFSNLGLVPLEKKAKKKNTVYISASEAGRAVVWGGERVVSPSPVHSSARFAPRLKFLGKSRAKKRKTNCANITSFPCSVLSFQYSSRPISVREIAQFP